MTRQKIREELFKLLFRIEFNNDEEMPEQLKLFFADDEKVIPAADEEYITNKYKKIIDEISDIDSIIDNASKEWTISRMGKVDLTILRLAVYEIKYDEDIPEAVAIDQAVELAKKYGQDESASFVNGILSGVVK